MDNFVSLWPKLIQNPEKTLKERTVSGKDAAITILLTSILVGFVFIMQFGLPPWWYPADLPRTPEYLFTVALGVFAFALLSYPLMFIFNSGVLFLLAKLLGGKGKFTDAIKHYSLVFSFIPVILLVSTILMYITELWIIVNVLLSIYVLYLYAMAVKTAHSLTTAESIGVVVAPMAFALFVRNSFPIALYLGSYIIRMAGFLI